MPCLKSNEGWQLVRIDDNQRVDVDCRAAAKILKMPHGKAINVVRGMTVMDSYSPRQSSQFSSRSDCQQMKDIDL